MARYRWTILALGTGAQTAYSAVFLGIPVLAPALQREYDLDLTEVGLAIAAANAGSVFTLLAWGLLADRVGERFVLGAGLAAWEGLIIRVVVRGGAWGGTRTILGAGHQRGGPDPARRSGRARAPRGT